MPFVRTCQHATFIAYDNCRFGTPWLKPTGVVGTLPNLCNLALRCNGCQQHLHLQGKVVDRRTGKQVWLTSLAGAYPPRLCRLCARIIGAAAPRAGWRRHHVSGMSSQWETDLRGTVKQPGTSSGRLPTCPLRFKLPFDPRGKTWGTKIGASCCKD